MEPRSPRIERHASPNESNEQQRARHLQLVQAAARHHAAAVADGLAQRGFALVDNFLPAETVSILRSECVSLLHGNKMYASESTRWDEESAQVVTYKKVNVMSYNLVGGTEYELAPRLTEYCVALVSSLPALINENFANFREYRHAVSARWPAHRAYFIVNPFGKGDQVLVHSAGSLFTSSRTHTLFQKSFGEDARIAARLVHHHDCFELFEGVDCLFLCTHCLLVALAEA
jgi:hypothetical protein